MDAVLSENRSTERMLCVYNPYNDQLIGTVSSDTKKSVNKSIQTADTYDFRLSAWERYEILTRFCELLLEHEFVMAQCISLESGKTIKDSRIEIRRAHQAFLLSAEEAKRINGEVIPLDAVAGMPKTMAMVTREPLGLVVAITPFNYPLNLVAHKVGPALAANNPIIVKPSSSTPLTAIKMKELLLQAGVPEEMLQIVVGEPSEIGDQLFTDARVQKVSFTGSVPVGKKISQQVGMKSLCMELGGNDPMIVLADAHLEKVIPAAVDGAYGNNGQRCTSVKRFIVEESIADEFVDRLVVETGKLTVGDQMDPDTDIGPLINTNAACVIEQRIDDSITAGAKLLCGGNRQGALMWPTVLDKVDNHNPIVADETFGPVAPVIRVADFEAAITVANDSCFGLQAGIFTNNLEHALAAASQIQAGAVMINRAPGFRAEHLPFGGIKDSGVGREGIRYAVESMTRLKTVVL